MKNQLKPSPSGTKLRTRTKPPTATGRVPPKRAWARKIDRRKAEPFDDAPAELSTLVEPKRIAASAVAALIRSGDDARRLFDVLRRFGADLEESQEALVELDTLLDAWQRHLPAGRRAGDVPFWSDVAALCRDLSEDLDDLNSVEFGMVRLLIEAIQNAALAHLAEARASTDD